MTSRPRYVARCRGCTSTLTDVNSRRHRGSFVGACRLCENKESKVRSQRLRTRRMVDARKALREEMLSTLLPSVRGSRKTAEFVVNSLTVHNPDLLRRAAALYAPRKPR